MKTTTVLSILIAFMFSSSLHSQTVTFESLPVPAKGFHNGDPSAGNPYNENFRSIGTRDNFGQVELLQLWEIGGVEFFNGYTPAYESWNGFSWSRVIDTTTQSYTNDMAAFPGGGSNGVGGVNVGENYLIAFGDDSYFNLPDFRRADSIDLANSTWTALTIANGDAFSKKFGGSSGNDPDLFGVTFTGYEGLNQAGVATGNATFNLADFRFSDNGQDYIVADWQTFDLSSLGNARSIGLSFFTTDVGTFGPNTPNYVALDNLRLSPLAIPEPASGFLITGIAIGWAFRRKKN